MNWSDYTIVYCLFAFSGICIIASASSPLCIIPALALAKMGLDILRDAVEIAKLKARNEQLERLVKLCEKPTPQEEIEVAS